MRKLIEGIVEFREKVLPDYREKFARLALGQAPDTLFFACSDSRVVPNLFASTQPGDLFVLRNVGNLIPHCGKHGVSIADESEAAAVEFALTRLNVRDIVVCGHSECGAMLALVNGRDNLTMPNLKSWLRHGEEALARTRAGKVVTPGLAEHNQVSQHNVLLQIEHLRSYPLVQERIAKGTLRIHGWWFDIAKADVYAYETELGTFVLLDEAEAKCLLERMGI